MFVRWLVCWVRWVNQCLGRSKWTKLFSLRMECLVFFSFQVCISTRLGIKQHILPEKNKIILSHTNASCNLRDAFSSCILLVSKHTYFSLNTFRLFSKDFYLRLHFCILLLYFWQMLMWLLLLYLLFFYLSLFSVWF